MPPKNLPKTPRKAAAPRSKAPPKQTRDAARTRARILEEAARIFAEKGYDGTSVSEVVDASRVNKRMVYHYFGDKEGLYRAVFLQLWSELKDWFDRALRKRIEESGGKPPTTAELLSEVLATFHDFLTARQRFPRLLMWEGLEGGAISRSIWKDVRGPLFVQVEFLLRQAQEEGLVDPELDPAHFIISFLGAVGYYFGYAPTLVDMIHKDPFSPAALEERKKQVQLLLDRLIRRG